MPLDEFRNCTEDTETEKEVLACEDKFDINEKDLEVKRKAGRIVQEHAIENINKEKAEEAIDESYEKNKEIQYSICADGELKSKFVGEEKSVKRSTKGEECRYVAGFFHTHQAKKDIETIVEPSPKDIFSSYQYSRAECIGRKIDVSGIGEEEDIRNTAYCIAPNRKTRLGERLWDKRFQPKRFIDTYKNARVIDRPDAIKVVGQKYWKD